MIIDLENGEANRDAKFVVKKMRKRNTVLMCLIWNTVLGRIQCNKQEASEPTT
jgi:hypothetical protein